MKKVTREFLIEQRACTDGFKWWVKNCEGLDTTEQIRKLSNSRNDWANWLIVRVMNYKQYVSYAVFAAEQVIDIFEDKFPEDKRPRKALEAAKRCIDNPTKENKSAAAAAAAAAAYAAAAYAAADASSDSYADSDAAAYAAAGIRTKIIEYGISLLEEK